MDYRNIMGTATNFNSEKDIIPAYLMMWVADHKPLPTQYYNAESFFSDLTYYMKEQAARNRYPILAGPDKFKLFSELKMRFAAWEKNPTKYFGDSLKESILHCHDMNVVRIIMRPVTSEFVLKTFRNL